MPPRQRINGKTLTAWILELARRQPPIGGITAITRKVNAIGFNTSPRSVSAIILHQRKRNVEMPELPNLRFGKKISRAVKRGFPIGTKLFTKLGTSGAVASKLIFQNPDASIKKIQELLPAKNKVSWGAIAQLRHRMIVEG